MGIAKSVPNSPYEPNSHQRSNNFIAQTGLLKIGSQSSQVSFDHRLKFGSNSYFDILGTNIFEDDNDYDTDGVLISSFKNTKSISSILTTTSISNIPLENLLSSSVDHAESKELNTHAAGNNEDSAGVQFNLDLDEIQMIEMDFVRTQPAIIPSPSMFEKDAEEHKDLDQTEYNTLTTQNISKVLDIKVENKPLNAAIAAMNRKRNVTHSNSTSLRSFLGRTSQSGRSSVSIDEYFCDSRQSPAMLTDPETTRGKLSVSYVDKSMEPVTKQTYLANNICTNTKKQTLRQYRMKKFNSTSTLYIDTVIINSEIMECLKYYATFLEASLNGSKNKNEVSCDAAADILSEKLHPFSVIISNKRNIQLNKKSMVTNDIFRYLECLFQSSNLATENVIISIVYVEKAIMNIGSTFQSDNWARLVLAGAIVACKVWDDQVIWNADFCQIFPEIDVKDLNALENYFLAVLDFDVNIKATEYVGTFYKVKNMTPFMSQPWALEPLTRSKISKIQFKPLSPIRNELDLSSQSLDKEEQIESKFYLRQVQRCLSVNRFIPIDLLAFVNF